MKSCNKDFMKGVDTSMTQNTRVEAVILAAGYSSRAGSFKMELCIEGKPVIQHVIDAFTPFCDCIYVVGGYQYEKLEALLSVYSNEDPESNAKHSYGKVRLVLNEAFELGMFSSVQTGVHYVKGDRFFLTPGDYPLIQKDIIEEMLHCEEDYVIPSFDHHAGHPILLPASAKAEIEAMEKDSNLKVFLKKKKVTYVEVNDQGILYDLDTMSDYEKLRQMKETGKGDG